VLGIRARLGRPRALIVVPNRELALQVLQVAKSLSHQGRFRSYASTGFIPLRKLARALEDPLDLLVVTPGRLEFLLASGRISLSDTRYVVTDESDTLLSEEHGFADTVQRVLLKPMQARAKIREEAHREEMRLAKAGGASALAKSTSAVGVQFVFCSASITPAVESSLARSFPSLLRLHTPSLHHVPSQLTMKNVYVKGRDKAELLWDTLQQESDSYKRRLMHHRTREQNKADIARLGGERQLLEHLVEQDCGARGVPLQALQASEAADRAEQEQRMQDDLDDEDASDPDALEDRREPHPEDARLPAARRSASAPQSAAAGAPSVYLPLPPTIIFCNTVSCCRAIAWFLSAKGLHVNHYHGLMPAHYRSAHLTSFVSGASNILVATDLASRGLDTTFVQHVVHFDFPFHVLDFVHRVGRTARGPNGAKGKSTALVEKKDRVLADAIERLTARGLSIEQLTGDKTRYGPDGMPLTAEVAAAERARAEARMNAAAAAKLTGAGSSGSTVSVSASGVKQLAPARRAAQKPSLRPGEQPRRRWMRYMRPSERNAHKLLYANRPELMPTGFVPKPEEPLQSARKLRRADDDFAADHSSSSPSSPAGRAFGEPGPGAHDPARDPFAFSSPFGRHRNAATPAIAAAAKAQTKGEPAHVQEARRRGEAVQAAADAAARSASGRPASSPFPLPAGISRRPGLARPLGPLAYKQRVGSIFAASTAQPGQAPPGQRRHEDPPEEARFDQRRFRSNSGTGGGSGGGSGKSTARPMTFSHKGRSATSGAARRREAVAHALHTGQDVGRRRPGVTHRRDPNAPKGPHAWTRKPRT